MERLRERVEKPVVPVPTSGSSLGQGESPRSSLSRDSQRDDTRSDGNLASKESPSPRDSPPILPESPVAGVSFADPAIPLSSSSEKGWLEWQDRVAFDKEPGTIVMRGVRLLGSESVELNLSDTYFPQWRYRRVQGTNKKEEKAFIPVRQAFESLLGFSL